MEDTDNKVSVWFDVNVSGMVSDEVVTNGLSRVSFRSAGHINTPVSSL